MPPSRPTRDCGTAAFGHVHTVGSRDDTDFGAATSAARLLAAYASPDRLTLSVARLASGSLGSALAGRDSQPKVGYSGFQGDIASPLLPDQDFLVARTFQFKQSVGLPEAGGPTFAGARLAVAEAERAHASPQLCRA